MTQKEILTIASDNELMCVLEQIAYLQSNQQFKTVYEQKAAKHEMKHFAKIIIDSLNSNK